MKHPRHVAKSLRSIAKGPRSRTKAALFATFTMAGLFANQVEAANYSYVGGPSGTWNTPSNYTTVAAGTPGTGTTAYPGAADNVTFNFAGLNQNETIYLAGNQAANLVTFNNTGTTSLLGGVSGTPAANTLTLAAGLTVNSGAGAVTLGDTSGSAAVSLLLTGSQTFTNNSSSALTFNSGVAASGTTSRALTIAGTGNTTFNGALTNASGTVLLSLTATGSGVLTLNGANTYTGATTMTVGSTLNLQGTLTSAITNTQGTLTIGSATNAAAGVSGASALVVTSIGTAGLATAASADVYGTIGGTGVVTVTGGFNLGAFTSSTFTLESTGKITTSATTTIQGSTANILGVISGAATTVTQSTLNLNYGLDVSHLTDAGVLTLNAATVNLIGGTHQEVVGSTTLGSTTTFGLTTISRSSGGATLALGTITRNGANTLNLSAASIATTGSASFNGILASGSATNGTAYAVVGTSGTTPGTSATADWAVGGGTITAYTGYTAFGTTTAGVTAASGAGTAAANYLLTDNGTTFSATPTTGFSGYTLKIDDTAAGQSLVIGGGTGTGTAVPALTLNGGGLLFVGGNDYAITGGTLRSNGGNTELDFHQYGAGTLSVSSTLATGSLVKDGAGTLVLTNPTANAVAGSTYINQGTLTVGAGAVSPFGTALTTLVYLQNGATLNLSAATALSLNALGSATTYSQGTVAMGANTLTLGTTGTLATIADFGGSITGTGGVIKNGTNTQFFLGANTYTGVTTINSGILNVGGFTNGGQAGGLGASSNAAANLVFNGGTLQYTGANSGSAATPSTTNPQATSTDRLFTVGTSGATIDASGANVATGQPLSATLTFSNAGALAYSGSGARTLTLAGANTGANTFAPLIADGTGGATSLVKSGAGSWTLTNAASSFTGGTTINAGTINETTPGALGTSGVSLLTGTLVLANAGTYNNPLTIAGGATFNMLNGATQAGNVTLTGAAGTTTRLESFASTGTISGQISGTSNIDFSSGSTNVNSVVTLTNPLNNYSGNTILSMNGTSGGVNNTVILGASNVIPNGVGKGDVFLNVTYSTGNAVLRLNGFNETINGLNSGGGGAEYQGYVQNGSATTNSTFTLGDNNANGNFIGLFQNTGTATLALAKIGTGTQTIGGVSTLSTFATPGAASTLTGGITVNAGSLNLDFSQATGQATTALANASNYLPATEAVTLNGGTFAVTGRGVGTAQSITSTTFISRNNGIQVTAAQAATIQPGQNVTSTFGGATTFVVTYVDRVNNFVYFNTNAIANATSGISNTYNFAAYSGAQSSQTLGGVTLGGGSSGVVINDNGAGATVLNMGNITRSVLGATLDFVVPAGAPSATEGALTTTTTSMGGVLATAATGGTAYATVGGAAWAANTTVVGTSRGITAVAGVNNDYTSATNNTNVTANTTQSGVTVNTLRFNTAARTLDLTGGQSTVAAGGILVTSATLGSGNAANITNSANDGSGLAPGAGPGAGTELVIIDNGALNVSASIVDGGGGATNLSISGFGTTTFTGVNNYQGTTTINGGTYTPGVTYTAANRPVQTVYVNGGTYVAQFPAQSDSGLGNNSVIVNANAVLAGTGVINTLAQNGSITINGGATVSPGAAPATVGILNLISTTTTFAGSPTSGLATLALDVAADGSHDLLRIFGNLDLSSTLDQISITGTAGAASYQLVTFTGALTGTFDNVLFNGGALPAGYSLSYATPGEIDLVTAVPEPGTWAALAVGATGLAVGYRRRRRQAAKAA